MAFPPGFLDELRSRISLSGLIGRRVKEGEDWITEKTTAAQDYVVSRGEGLRDRVKEVAEVIGRN